MSGPAALSAAAFRDMCAFIYRRSGIVYDENKRYYLERRVHDRMERTASASFPVYFDRLRTDAAEAEALLNSVTINETYFYREDHQFACLVASMLPEIITRRAPGDLIRIWSMPCSTGEEPYSLALWLLENWRLVDAYHVDIVGSDIDTAALQAAREGRFGARALSRLPADVLARYFEPEQDGMRRIIADLQGSVTFTAANLIDPASAASAGRFDVIFCRNLLIYFDDAARLGAAAHLYDALLPGGFLCLGHTESMARISDRFVTRRFPDAVVYQRALS